MNLHIKFKNVANLFFLATITTTISSCQSDDIGEGNGLTTASLDAGFTITEVSDATNTYLLTANHSYISSNWDIDNGEGFTTGGNTKEIFFPDADTYTVQHKVSGIGGESALVSQTIDVETSDPLVGNIVKGGKLKDTNDHNEWTILNISDNGAQWIFNQGSATILSTQEWAQQGIYQAIEVVKDQKYSVDMLVSAEGSFTNTWFEVYAGTTPPVQGQEYSDNRIMGLSTWDGCATSAFSGWLSEAGCVKNSNTDTIDNTVTFSESGTIYLVIRSGGQDFNAAGITIKNIEIRGVK
ncbi:hypothetical protein [Wenyingzhuangia sp. 2_MG-2023]|uniref:hypothetical protein n=1 Tax=Wenyingzhuangia sp. 2_MG-2023 TaxID=3062639 RepID=UPI0026E21071|nr:hypothetical protein [Wenyingzhuangia sp. 2_MG-2023]MDO6737159.1 hypothetical protein [Wenyingzhuangia sp. 2_MG-2023]